MAKSKYPITPAVRFLRSKGIGFKPHTYAYSDHGGANQAAQALKVPAHRVVKTLVMETDNQVLFLMLMHGDREVSTRQLARVIGRKKVFPAAPAAAERVTGCRVGGISPFTTRNRLPVLPGGVDSGVGIGFHQRRQAGFSRGDRPRGIDRTAGCRCREGGRTLKEDKLDACSNWLSKRV